MPKDTARALIACGDAGRRTDYAQIFLQLGWNIHTVTSGLELLDLLRKQRYAMAVIDATVRDMEPVECVMNMRDLAAEAPATVVADDEVAKRERFWSKAGVAYAGPYSDAIGALPDLIHTYASNGKSKA